MDYELKLEKSPKSPRFQKDRLTPISKRRERQIDKVKLKNNLITPVSLFPKSEKQSLFDSKSIKNVTMYPFLANPTIKSQIRRRVPAQPQQTIQISNTLTDYNYCPIDWSIKNIIAFALDTKTILINPKLATKSTFHCYSADAISLRFNSSGTILALGSLLGPVRLFDVETESPLCTFQNVNSAVFSIDTNLDNFLVSTHEKGYFFISDFRESTSNGNNSLKFEAGNGCYRAVFSPDGSKLAVSHNGNNVSIFDLRNMSQPICVNKSHESIVHPIAWSPHSPEMIITGGGLSDRSMKIWNVNNGKIEKQVKVGAQICNIFWTKDTNEIISTQGFDYNNIIFWNESEMKMTGSIRSHHARILYATLSNDENTLVTVTENDPIQFWDLRQNISNIQTIR